MSIALRIKELARIKKFNISTFEKEIGAGSNSIGTLIQKNSNVSGNLLNKILIRFTDVSPDWLLTGTEPMFRNGLISTVNPILKIQSEREKDLCSQIEILKENRLYLNKTINGLQLDLQECEQQKKLSTNNTDGN